MFYIDTSYDTTYRYTFKVKFSIKVSFSYSCIVFTIDLLVNLYFPLYTCVSWSISIDVTLSDINGLKSFRLPSFTSISNVKIDAVKYKVSAWYLVVVNSELESIQSVPSN